MLTVNCRDVPAIKTSLAAYVADQIAAVPSLKLHEFVLSPINEEIVIAENAIVAIKNFLKSINQENSFAVVGKDNTIFIVSIDGKILDHDKGSSDQFFSCTHCGYITRYEQVYNNHVKIHYL